MQRTSPVCQRNIFLFQTVKYLFTFFTKNTSELVLPSPDESMFSQQKVTVSAELLLTFNLRVANGGSRVLPIQSVVSCLSYFVIPPLSSPQFSVLMDFCYSSTCFYSPQLSIIPVGGNKSPGFNHYNRTESLPWNLENVVIPIKLIMTLARTKLCPTQRTKLLTLSI